MRIAGGPVTLGRLIEATLGLFGMTLHYKFENCKVCRQIKCIALSWCNLQPCIKDLQDSGAGLNKKGGPK